MCESIYKLKRRMNLGLWLKELKQKICGMKKSELKISGLGTISLIMVT